MNAPLNEIDEILAMAAERGGDKGLGYAGEVTPVEAHLLASRAGAIIVDTRSEFEHRFIGRVPGTRLIEWKRWPSGEVNPNFVTELREGYEPDDILLLLCRSGVRSHQAGEAAARAGFSRVFNILEGFEGDLDPEGQRGKLGGWRKAGLPWIQD
jgi:rhodanese-related sulfurtransferase